MKLKLKTEAFKLLQDRSKYTDNMIKWDIIHTWVFSYGKGSGGNETDFSAKFLDFQTTPTKIQYKLEVTPKDEKPVIYYTSMDGTIGGEYGGYAFNKDDIGSIGAYSETGLSWSYYTIPLSQAATGLAINSLVS